jgi:uncharacterized Zn finger protein (UPF0148 family)
MPIKVSCTCGASFAAKDELAGKTLPCPKCRQPLAIPGGATPAQRKAPAPQSAADLSAPTIFDDAGMKARQHTGQVCPSCYHPMQQGTIICIHCGYSLKLGRKMEMEVIGKGEGGHGELAAQALQRAANMLEDDKREERKKVSEGVPWWAYLILFCGAVGLLTMMMLLPPATATTIALMLLGGGGVLMGLYAQICVIVIAFRDNVAQGLCVLFVPCYFFIYIIMKWDQCATLFLIWLGGQVIQGLAYGVFLAIGAGLNDPNKVELPSSDSLAIVRAADELNLR